ncbi:hypothetical protein HY024_00630 [Candidatus Curtissbacteria bacterium]|nr:hypothetical protein [Candidatus Curtissbacteria bacterium]
MKKLAVLLTQIVSILFFPSITFAEESPKPTPTIPPPDLPNSPATKFTSAANLPAAIINTFVYPFLIILVFLTVFYIIRAGIQFVRSSGDPKVVADARSRLIFALVGLTIIILSYAITQLIDKLILGGTTVFK